MKRILFLVTICVATGSTAFGQQDPLYSQYLNNPFVLNPGYTGLTNDLNASVSYRQQWVGYEGSPTTVNANGHTSLMDNSMGVGLMIVSDKIGATSVKEIYGSYAYRISVASRTTLSFGLQAGLVNFKTANSDLTLLHSNDPAFIGETNESKPSFGSGVIVTNDKFFAGVSVPRMLKVKADAEGSELTAYTQHLYAIGSYMFFLTDRIRFRPSILAKLVSGAPTSMDVNAAFILHEKYMAGILTRNFSTHGIFLQAVVKDFFRFGYALEVPTGKSVGAQFTTHEITLGLRLKVLPYHSSLGVMSY
jgi:type IX secretion system PorP/SprF family membrane protein